MSAFRTMTSFGSADVVVVGGGTVGAWTAVLLAENSDLDVVLLEARTLGDGASSRAAGMVRAQGGTETAIRLGLRTQEFYAASGDRFPLDCGFVAQGYLMPCFSDADVAAAHDRIALQRSLGLDVEWLSSDDIDSRGTGLAPGVTRGASYAPGDGYIDAPRNVLAYTAALTACGVDVRERCAFTGLRVSAGRVVGVDTSDGPIDTARVVLTGGPQLADVGARAGARIPAGGTRHQVVVTSPLPDVDVDTLPMVFDVTSGIYWRPGEAGGLLWGMSNPDEPPGVATSFDNAYYHTALARLETLFPAAAGVGLRRTWAATIDYTADHLPILGPLLTDDGPVDGTVVASAAGHGMMWGPAVAQVAADLARDGACTWLDLTDLGLDRFDADGHSRVAPEPISLPFPETTEALAR
ncbi:4-methylaminobutanoate oxidase (formaldehyde-forming) [Mycolicibacterium chubuense]|uniref:4-methylaminobutanoate oxidase (Formaldehyde-forming) n=2 Tax=Mycolicibacterium chubuense TaxID=1800 RepID=A0A0J6WCA2_MYCCU|nr:4-methylaminobutanoate oxidase (formaldehyde-forming) [Mycolicibacterium chubuense]SPX99477.1 oxidoreductase, FAD-binding protein [Mycolicibacterium chubuense]